MSSDFDFGEFLDESNQSELMILCLDLFGILTKFKVDHNKLEAAKIEVLNNQLTKNFEGFRLQYQIFQVGIKLHKLIQ